jgi:hypothetical protein
MRAILGVAGDAMRRELRSRVGLAFPGEQLQMFHAEIAIK